MEDKMAQETRGELTKAMNCPAPDAARNTPPRWETSRSPSGRTRAPTAIFFTASSLVIRYRDPFSGEFKDGTSYSQFDLLALSEAARQAGAKIRELSKGRGRANPSLRRSAHAVAGSSSALNFSWFDCCRSRCRPWA
jgi:hypothetical protein